MELVDNHYQFPGGIDPLQLCREFGTPLYVYDAAVMERQYRRLTAAFPYPKLHIHYACKALSNLTVLRLFRQWGAGLDCVSIQEVQLGLLAGFPPSDILYTPNFAGMDEFDEAVRLGVKINVDAIPMLENWGLLWMWHSVVILVLCVATQMMGWANVQSPRSANSPCHFQANWPSDPGYGHDHQVV